jgi:gliding motility-associated-like protein
VKKIIQLTCSLGLFLLSHEISFAQVTADFSVSDSIGCNPFTVQFTNNGSSAPELTYDWYFGSDGPYSEENPEYTFNNGGVYAVRFVVTDTTTMESDEITRNITVIQTPTAGLTIDQSNACVNGNVEFVTGSASKDSVLWDFGDGTYSKETGSRYIYHAYSANGSYDVRYITYYQTCSDTSSYTIDVDGPIADFTMSSYEECKGSPVIFSLKDTTDIQSFYWDVGENGITLNGDSAVHRYDTMGDIIPKLHVTGLSGTCIIDDTIHIFVLQADFTYPEDQLCDQETVFFQNNSTGDDALFWNFGNGHTSFNENPTQTFATGTYDVSLRISHVFGCQDSTVKTLVINDPPEILLSEYAAVCPGASVQIQVSGGDIVHWEPSEDFNDPDSYTPTVSPDEDSIVYYATITDTETHCSSSDSITVVLQAALVPGKIVVFPTDTSIIIGDTVSVFAYDSLNRNEVIYEWLPTDGILTCSDCPDPAFRPLSTTTYTLTVSDTNFCFVTESFDVNIEVREEYRIGLPDAFTPNGDDINDVIKVHGWGIKNLIEFRIYNRWGNEVFYTDDINHGWDGYYQGKLQSIDSYAYVIKAEMWDDNIVVDKGTFSLLR